MAKKTDNFEPNLTVKEVARFLNVSERTVHRRIRSGDLPAFKDGNIVRVRPSDLRAYQLQRMLR